MVKMIGAVMDTETVSRSEASATGYSFFALIEKPSTNFARLVNNKTIDGVSINPWNIGDSLTINPIKVILNEHGEPTLSARKRENLSARTTTEIVKEKLMISLRQKAVETALTSANVMANMVDRETENSKIEDEIEALENLKLRKSLQDRLRLAKGEAAPPEAQEEEQEEEQEEAEKETTVVIQHQTNGSRHQVTIKHKDMERHTLSPYISLTDLAYYAIKFEEVPKELGLPSEVVEDGPVDVYLEALLSMNGAEPVTLPTIGKQAKAAAIDIGEYGQGATVFLRARLPTQPKPNHPEWLRASAGETQSPSPTKKAKRDPVTVPSHNCASKNRLMRGCRRRGDPTGSRSSPKRRKGKQRCKLTRLRRRRKGTMNNKRGEQHQESKKANRTCRSYKTSNKADWRNNTCMNNYLNKPNYLSPMTNGGQDGTRRGTEEMRRDTTYLNRRERDEGGKGGGSGRCLVAELTQQERGTRTKRGRGETRGANENGGPLPRTHTEAAREETEGLEIGVELGSTKCTPTRAEENERTWERGLLVEWRKLSPIHGSSYVGNIPILRGMHFPYEFHQHKKVRKLRKLLKNHKRNGNYEIERDVTGTTGEWAELDTTKPCRNREAAARRLGIGARVHRVQPHEYEGDERNGNYETARGVTGTTGEGEELDTTKQCRNREAVARRLGIGTRVHRVRPHKYEEVGVRGQSHTLESEGTLSKVSRSTRVRKGISMKRRKKKEKAPHGKMGIYTQTQGIPTLSAKHNERVARSSTGRSYIVFDEVAGHGEDAAVMLVVAKSLTIARFHRSVTNTRITSPPLEQAALESTSHEETTSRKGGPEGKHHGACAGVQVRTEGALPVTGCFVLLYQVEEAPVHLEAASETAQGEDGVREIPSGAGKHRWELNPATLRDAELEPRAVNVIEVIAGLTIEAEHAAGNRLGGSKQPVAEVIRNETGMLLDGRIDTTGSRYLVAEWPLPSRRHRRKTNLWEPEESLFQKVDPSRNCGPTEPERTRVTIAAGTRTAVAKMHSVSDTRSQMDTAERLQQVGAEVPSDILLLPLYHGIVPMGLHHPARSAMVGHIKGWSGETEADLRKKVVAHTWTANYSAPWIHDTSRKRQAPFQKISPVAELNERMYRDSIKEGASSPGAEGTIRAVLKDPEKYWLEVVTAVYQALVDSQTGDGTLDHQTGNTRFGDRRQPGDVKVTMRISAGQQLISECHVYDASLDTREAVEEAMQADVAASTAVENLQEAAHKCEAALTQQRKARRRMSEERKRKRDADS